MKEIDEHFEKSIGSSQRNFVNFIKLNTDNYSDKELKDIDFLVQRIAKNMYLYPRNIDTAKTDYISLLGRLLQKGYILKKYKNLKPDSNYFPDCEE